MTSSTRGMDDTCNAAGDVGSVEERGGGSCGYDRTRSGPAEVPMLASMVGEQREGGRGVRERGESALAVQRDRVRHEYCSDERRRGRGRVVCMRRRDGARKRDETCIDGGGRGVRSREQPARADRRERCASRDTGRDE